LSLLWKLFFTPLVSLCQVALFLRISFVLLNILALLAFAAAESLLGLNGILLVKVFRPSRHAFGQRGLLNLLVSVAIIVIPERFVIL
jgi:hypothetical protein